MASISGARGPPLASAIRHVLDNDRRSPPGTSYVFDDAAAHPMVVVRRGRLLLSGRGHAHAFIWLIAPGDGQGGGEDAIAGPVPMWYNPVRSPQETLRWK